MNQRTAKTRILIVADQPIVREWFAQLIHQEPDLELCGESTDAFQTLQAIRTLRPDLVVLDMSMGGIQSTDLIKDISHLHRSLPVLVLSLREESLFGARAIRAGARGYICKQEGGKNVKLAIHQVLKGEIYVGEKTHEKVPQKLEGSNSSPPMASPHESLSDRELQIFQLLGCGHGPSQIAAELHLSVKTVEGYEARIKEKLKLKDARELHQRAIEWHKWFER